MNRTGNRLFLAAAALAVAAGCRTTPSPVLTRDEALSRHARAAHRAFADGDVATAAAQYELALRRAGALDDAASIAVMACNLAACRLETGHLESAAALADESIAEARRAGQNATAAELLAVRIALERGDRTRAKEALKTLASGRMTPSERAARTVLQADMESRTDRFEEALKTLDTGRSMVDRAAPELRAKAWEVRGSALASLQRRRESAEAMESAAGAWAEAGRANSVAAALAGAARQYALLADHDAAKDGSLRADVVRAAYRAARAAAGAGNAALARTMMDLARRWAPTGDPAIQTRLAHPPFLTEDTALPTPTP